MATDGEIEAAFHHRAMYRSTMSEAEHREWRSSPNYRGHEWFIAAHMETRERRERISRPLMRNAESRYTFCANKKSRWAEGINGYQISGAIKEVQMLYDSMQVGDCIDTKSVVDLLIRLQKLQGEIEYVRRETRPIRAAFLGVLRAFEEKGRNARTSFARILEDED